MPSRGCSNIEAMLRKCAWLCKLETRVRREFGEVDPVSGRHELRGVWSEDSCRRSYAVVDRAGNFSSAGVGAR